MILETYPDPKIHQTIMDTFVNVPDLELKLVKIEVGTNISANERSWRYTFSKEGSATNVTFSLLYPSYFGCSCMFVKEPTVYFAFSDYLKKIKDDEVKNLSEFYHRAADPELRTLFFYDYLKVVQKHLTSDLKNVARGEEWIEVPFDWEVVGR